MGFKLRFRVPESERQRVRRAVAASPARVDRLQAQYFDTPDRRLAEAGITLQLQLQGGRWTQTARRRADLPRRGLGHTVAIDAVSGKPALALERFAGSPVGKALDAALGDAGEEDLSAWCGSDIVRTRRRFRSGRTIVELSLDVGDLGTVDDRLPVFDLGFEWIEGPVDGVIRFATRWVDRHGLWLDGRNTDDPLRRGTAAEPATTAGTPRLRATMSPDAALRAMVACCLEQILPNAAAVAAGDGSPEQLHQTRVGLRRLRSALRTYGNWSGAIDPAWPAALGRLFGRLGQARDSDTVQAMLPLLQAAGAPPMHLAPTHGQGAATDALRAPEVTRLLLGLIGFTLGDGPAGESPRASLIKIARTRLAHLHRRVHRDAALFAGLDDTGRHRVRKRLKRLRYSTELVAELFPAKPLQRYLATLRPAQDALGLYNDAQVAQMAFLSLVQDDPRAWFALGWLSANQPSLLRDASRALRCLPAKPGFLRRS